MKNSIFKFLMLALVISAPLSLSAQCSDWKWPEDKATAEEKNVLYTDALRGDNFQAAVAPHSWLLKHAPDLNTAIYINGEKIYKGLLESTKDAALQDAYFDSLMMIYDMRMKYCGEEKDVIAKKAYQNYRHNARNAKAFPGILELFDEAYALNGNDLDYYLILPYMSAVVNNAKLKHLNESQILEHYDKIVGVIEYKMSNNVKADKMEDYKAKVDGMLVDVVDINCDFVRANFGPKFKEKPTDIKLAKKIFGFMLKDKCTDDPLWLEAGMTIMATEPEFGLAKNLGLKYKGEDNAKATELFNKAIELTDDPSQKADMYIQLGTMKSGSAAREMYRKALGVDPTKAEAYGAIGYLYYQSFETCAGKEDIVKDRAVFLAAYDMFSRAGNSKMMQSSKEQFPSKEEIFTYNYTAGDNISVGCWIGESTTIRTRD